MPRRQSAAAPPRLGIAVDAEHAALRGFEQGRAVAAGAESGVDVDGAVAWRQRVQHFLEQDRDMLGSGLRGFYRRRPWPAAGSRRRPASVFHDGRRAAPPRAGKVVPWRRERSRTAARCSE